MKKILFVCLLVLVMAFGVVACAPVEASAIGQPDGIVLENAGSIAPDGGVELPSELGFLIAVGVGYLVTQGLKSASTLVGRDLTRNAAAITASLVTSITLFINALLSAVPEQAQQPVAILLALIVATLSSFGVHYTVKGFQAKG